MARYEFDLAIVGGGSAGLSLAGIAGHAGMKVALIEKARLGGECLHAGCVPSKALLAAAHLVHRARQSRAWGLPEWTVGEIRLGEIMDRVARVVDALQEHETPKTVRDWGVAEFVAGRARFVDPHTLEVSGESGARRLTAARIALCVGSSPALPDLPGLREAEPWTNENLFEQRELPERLVVLGGGPIGCEMGQAFARLGSRVAVVESDARLLPRDDPEAGEWITRRFRDEGIELHLGRRAERVERSSGRVRIRLEGGEMVEGDALLAALGRRPNLEDLNLEAAGIRAGDDGIEVDAGLRTTARHVWALGDANGGFHFSHVAEYEARAVAAAILFGWPARADYPLVPWTTFTDPEVAHTGLSEVEARRRHGRVSLLRYDFDRVDRAHAEGSPEGFLKVVTAGWRGRVVGAEVVGPAAGELIHEWSLAVRHGLTASQISNLVHVYPTLAMANQRAADRFFETSPAARFAARWARRWFRWRRRREPAWRRDG